MYDAEQLDRMTSQLCEQIRYATWGLGEWIDLCKRLTEMFPGSYCALLNQSRTHRAFNSHLSDGLEQEHITSFVEHYSKVNPWTSFWVNASSGSIMVAERDDPAIQFRGSEFYEDWMRRTGDFDAAVGLRISANASEIIYLPVHYSTRYSEAYDPAIEYVMKGVRSALYEAVRIREQIRDTGMQVIASSSLIERNNNIAFVVDDSLTLKDANDPAECAFRAATLLKLTRGQVTFADRRNHKEFVSLLNTIDRPSHVQADRGKMMCHSLNGPVIVNVTRLPTDLRQGLIRHIPSF